MRFDSQEGIFMVFCTLEGTFKKCILASERAFLCMFLHQVGKFLHVLAPKRALLPFFDAQKGTFS